jgi:uncharacterized membrane protein (UPF0127 family)
MLAENIIIPKTLLDQTLGLLKYNKPVTMLLKTHFGIHTFGMKYPIDIIILNSQNQIVALKKNLWPNSIYVWDIQYSTVLELPNGVIQKSKTQLQDDLSFQ